VVKATLCGWLAALALASSGARGTDLTTTELTWLGAAFPVLTYARELGLPLDIVVQPHAAPGETPLGMAFIGGRCKLVLSMRGNPQAQATLDMVEPSLLGPVVEAIVAHELGHCWRHLQQTWGTLPLGLTEARGLSRVTAQQAELLKDMWQTRREEAFADLVGLAWTLQHNPSRYAEVHAWNTRLREVQVIDTGPHDTRKWIRLAANKAAFTHSASIFEQVGSLWEAGFFAGF
jgi:hypothetical protein